MKEELKLLKDNTTEVIKLQKEFNEQRKFFNMKVKETNEKLNIEEIFDYEEDSYDAAKTLIDLFPDLHNIITILRKQHPRFGNKKIANLILKEHNTLISSDVDKNTFDRYFLYEGCGFFKVLEIEQELQILKEQTFDIVRDVTSESKDKVTKVGKNILEVLKPYGEVAKGQFIEAKKKTKTAVNKGSKKLIKVLTDVENKTEE